MNNDLESTVFFTTDKETQPFHKQQIQWSDQSIENFLVVVHDKGGNLSGLLLSDKHKFAVTCTGCSREETYTVHVYGLKKQKTESQTVTEYRVIDCGRETIVSLNKESNKDHMHTSMMNLENHSSSTYNAFLINTLKVELHDQINRFTTGLEVDVHQRSPLEFTIYPKILLVQDVKCLIAVCHVLSQEESLIVSSAPLATGIPILSEFKSRSLYQIRILSTCDCLHCSFKDFSIITYQGCRNSSSLTIKTCMVKKDILQLLLMAKTYCDNNTQYPQAYQVTQFYRNKPYIYYKDIFINHRGVMKKYIKDNNGDQFSPINNNINGLFFSASINPFTRKPPNFSYYGDTRLFIPVEDMFTADTNVYFSDFYCHYETHYVTLVLTKQGSAEDQFCQARLVQLDPKDNPFFWLEETTVHNQTITQKENHHKSQKLRLVSNLDATPGSIPKSQSSDPVHQTLPDVYHAPCVHASQGCQCALQTLPMLYGYSYSVQQPGIMYHNLLPMYRSLPHYPYNTYHNHMNPAKSSQPHVNEKKKFMTGVVSKFHVEFFFTEDIDIHGLMEKNGQQKVYFQFVEGRGQSRKDGIPKKADCTVCNLPPQNQ